MRKIIRIKEVIDRTGLSRTTIWRLEKSGRFPGRIKLSARSVGWFECQVDEWIRDRRQGFP